MFLANNNICILAVGDISYARDINKYIQKNKNNYNIPLKQVRNLLKDSDITIANFENVIIPQNGKIYKPLPHVKSYLHFNTNSNSVKGIKNSGIDIVSLANNHINDYGEYLTRNTYNEFKSNDINVIGIKPNPYKIYNFGNIKIGILGATYDKGIFRHLIGNEIVNKNLQEIYSQIKDIRTKVDILIVVMHWGMEYYFNNNQTQKDIAVQMAKKGVDIIIGHHPHVIQNKEILVNEKNGKKCYIFYSLGNFLFDSHKNRRGVRNSMILKILINKDTKDIKFKYMPCIIDPRQGFSPIPQKEEYQDKFPFVITKYANNLDKYLKCARRANCKYLTYYKKKNHIVIKKYCEYVIIILLILNIVLLFYKNI